MVLESPMMESSGNFPKRAHIKQSDQQSLAYDARIAALRKDEYPMLEGITYMDHAGTALYSRSLIETFSVDMMTSLVGNPHSASHSSLNSKSRIDNVRVKVLNLFNANPEEFEVVFVANATAGVKLVVDALQSFPKGFWYGYHKDSHTSLVGPREVAAAGAYCFRSDEDVAEWIDTGKSRSETSETPCLFAYPAQSNMNGRRLPLEWSDRLRRSKHVQTYSLLDAAGLVSTTPLDLSNSSTAPDFTVLSFYKIFGFPDLGALIVRKDSAHIFQHRKYFGGGTVEMVSVFDQLWHERKNDSLHGRLEDGTLPIRSIMALDCAIKVHERLYGSLTEVSRHTTFLAQILYKRLAGLKHGTGVPVCHIYKDTASTYGDMSTQGATIAFNLRDSQGNWRSNHEVNKLAIVKNIHIRTGTMCNPGGTSSELDISSHELRSFYNAGFRCGNENDVRGGKPVGMIRASLGAMSILEDVHRFVQFIEEFFVEASPPSTLHTNQPDPELSTFVIESLTIYPIKSCGGWSVPHHVTWNVKPEGLQLDREFCLIHRGTRATLSQKRYPKMARIKPVVDIVDKVLQIHFDGPSNTNTPSIISISLENPDLLFGSAASSSITCPTNVCGDKILPRVCIDDKTNHFFTTHLDVPCQLAWLPSDNTSLGRRVSKLQSKSLHLPVESSILADTFHSMPGSFPTPPPSPPHRPLLLANESPILTISRSSLTELSRALATTSGTNDINISPEVFRANIVISSLGPPGNENPYVEESWHRMQIVRPHKKASEDILTTQHPSQPHNNGMTLQILGPCRRCQMVCIDQSTGIKGQEPFLTLAKTRARNGGVWFGIHCGLDASADATNLKVGDIVRGSD